MNTQFAAFDPRATPLRIGKVTLKVRDLAPVSEFYQHVIGLGIYEDNEGHVVLGTSREPLLELVGDPSLAPADPHAPGLFHTAFLLPSREYLARWMTLATEQRIPLQGASDHNVSEAIYLADPEGNGIEIYADRPPSQWRDGNGAIHMTTKPLDVEDLLAARGGNSWAGFPEDGLVGHIHLKVGDTGSAERFYHGVLGLDVTTRYPGASFFGSGGYHHQIAGNIWNSANAGGRQPHMAGLDKFEIVAADQSVIEAILSRARRTNVAVAREDPFVELEDFWGIKVRLLYARA